MNENNNNALKNEEPIESDNGLLASRWDRLGASLIDTIIIMCIIIPAVYFTIGFDKISDNTSTSIFYGLAIGAVSMTAFALLHGKLLITNGQTIGKKMVGIKIVGLNGNLPTTKQVVKRYSVYFLRVIPFVGPYISMVNILFIFRKDKRCIHDLVAGTKVVNCQPIG